MLKYTYKVNLSLIKEGQSVHSLSGYVSSDEEWEDKFSITNRNRDHWIFRFLTSENRLFYSIDARTLLLQDFSSSIDVEIAERIENIPYSPNSTLSVNMVELAQCLNDSMFLLIIYDEKQISSLNDIIDSNKKLSCLKETVIRDYCYLATQLSIDYLSSEREMCFDLLERSIDDILTFLNKENLIKFNNLFYNQSSKQTPEIRALCSTISQMFLKIAYVLETVQGKLTTRHYFPKESFLEYLNDYKQELIATKKHIIGNKIIESNPSAGQQIEPKAIKESLNVLLSKDALTLLFNELKNEEGDIDTITSLETFLYYLKGIGNKTSEMIIWKRYNYTLCALMDVLKCHNWAKVEKIFISDNKAIQNLSAIFDQYKNKENYIKARTKYENLVKMCNDQIQKNKAVH